MRSGESPPRSARRLALGGGADREDPPTVGQHRRGRRGGGIRRVDRVRGQKDGCRLGRAVEGGELSHGSLFAVVSVRAVKEAVTGASSECCGARRVQMPAMTAMPMNIAITDQMLPVQAMSCVANQGEKPAQTAAPTP